MANAAPFYGNSGNDTFYGGSADDNMYGGAGEDALYGGAGADNLRGGDGADSLYGGDGNDTLNGDAGADSMYGGDGDDTYVVDDVNDIASEAGGSGNDTVKASVSYTIGAGIERLDLTGVANLNGTGNAGDNTLKGNAGDNVLTGLDGKDSISGGDGADKLVGGAGHDWLQGGAGADDFMLDAVGATETAGAVSTKTLNSTSSDAITDFTHGVDRIVVQAADYTGVNVGVLDAANFVTGTAADAAHAQFIYDAAHKALMYDADGTGSGQAVKIADINAGATVTASDIFVQPLAGPAHVLDFEDFGPNTVALLPDEYHGFSITSPMGAVVMGANQLPGYAPAGTALTNMGSGTVVWTNYGQLPLDIHRSDNSDFVFEGVDLAMGIDHDLHPVTVAGYLDGHQVFSMTFQAGATPVHIDGHYVIDDFVVTSPTMDPVVVIDNFGYDLFPHG